MKIIIFFILLIITYLLVGTIAYTEDRQLWTIKAKYNIYVSERKYLVFPVNATALKCSCDNCVNVVGVVQLPNDVNISTNIYKTIDAIDFKYNITIKLNVFNINVANDTIKVEHLCSLPINISESVIITSTGFLLNNSGIAINFIAIPAGNVSIVYLSYINGSMKITVPVNVVQPLVEEINNAISDTKLNGIVEAVYETNITRGIARFTIKPVAGANVTLFEYLGNHVLVGKPPGVDYIVGNVTIPAVETAATISSFNSTIIWAGDDYIVVIVGGSLISVQAVDNNTVYVMYSHMLPTTRGLYHWKSGALLRLEVYPAHGPTLARILGLAPYLDYSFPVKINEFPLVLALNATSPAEAASTFASIASSQTRAIALGTTPISYTLEAVSFEFVENQAYEGAIGVEGEDWGWTLAVLAGLVVVVVLVVRWRR